MSKSILGISAFYHDSAAALISDGEIIAAAQEERFSRKKHDPRFPKNAINYCLEEAYIEASELDAIVFYDNPLLTIDRIIKNCIMSGERGLLQFEKAVHSTFAIKYWIKEYIENMLGSLGRLNKLLYSEHHFSHAASAFYPSPFKSAAILTIDGVGEWTTTALGFGNESDIKIFKEIKYPHSLGLLYSAFTYFCGFKVNSGEYKLMGLAPFGKPKYYDLIVNNLIDIKKDGSYRLNTEYFGYTNSLVMTNEKFNELFKGQPRSPETRISRREMDIASSIQKVTEEIVLLMARNLKKETDESNLVLAGGVALNCVANGKIYKERIFNNIWIQPASGDAGGAIGSALLVYHSYFNEARKNAKNRNDKQHGSFLGPSYSSSEILAYLDRNNFPFKRISNVDERAKFIAQQLADGKIVAYFSGRMEFGPRALGARSILGDPRNSETQSKMNLKIKFRESFRPFAPSVLLNDAKEYFELDIESPYMLLVADVLQSRRLPINPDDITDIDDLIQIVNKTRSDIPAVTHVDYSARIQTVNEEIKQDYYQIIEEFKKITGYGIIVNTSFNVRGEPIVCSPQDAYKCFMRSNIDILVMEDFILMREQQPIFEDGIEWRKEYELD